MSEQSIEKTEFCPGPGYGLWEFTRMPYALTGAMQHVNGDWIRSSVIARTVLTTMWMTSSSSPMMLNHTFQILGACSADSKRHDSSSDGGNIFLGRDTTSHLGFEYSWRGVTPSEGTTQAVVVWPTPTSTKDIRSFLGLVNFYQRFIPKFADIAAPTELTGSDAAFRWEDEQ